MKPKNPSCDGEWCKHDTGEIRVLPLDSEANLLLCYDCFIHEMEYRRERNRMLDIQDRFDLPLWSNLKVYPV